MNFNNFICTNALDMPLSNGENRSFRSCTYHKFIEKISTRFLFLEWRVECDREPKDVFSVKEILKE
jgi:hypothetical protein